ncbi:PKD domain-containing protein [Candidatus Margulisiibacteriota bacterium]
MRKYLACGLLIILCIILGCGRTRESTLITGSPFDNMPPQILSLIIDANNVNAPHIINFTAIVSDPDEVTSNLQLIWDFGDGTTINAQSPAHNYTYQGEFAYSLTVYDSRGASANREGATTIKLIGGNHRPQITTYNAAPVTPGLGQIVTFTGDGTDADVGDTLTYVWRFGDGEFVQAKNTSHAYASSGLYTAKLIISDQHGAMNWEEVLIAVATNMPPTIQSVAWLPTENLQAPATVNFTAAATDIDGTVVSYFWRFGDGASFVSQNPMHVYTNAGAYSVELTVVDNEGGTTITQNSLQVLAE